MALRLALAAIPFLGAALAEDSIQMEIEEGCLLANDQPLCHDMGPLTLTSNDPVKFAIDVSCGFSGNRFAQTELPQWAVTFMWGSSPGNLILNKDNCLYQLEGGNPLGLCCNITGTDPYTPNPYWLVYGPLANDTEPDSGRERDQ